MDTSNQPPASIDEWHFAGNLSSYPDIHNDKDGGYRVRAGCTTLCIPRPEQQPGRARMSRSNLDEQVLVFKYKGCMHAIDNVSYLS